MKRGHQTSAGGVIVKKRQGEWKAALLLREGRTVWALPKGLIEKGEKREETAIREVTEETGLEGEILTFLGTVKYWYYSRWNNTNYHKTVHFYLMKALRGSIENHDHESDAVKWVPLKAAKKQLSFLQERQIMTRAIKKIAKLI